MKLSQLGEFGLRRRTRSPRPRSGDRARRRAPERRARRDAGRARRGGALPARLDLVARPRLSRRRRESQRPRRVRRRARGAVVTLAAPGETESPTSSSCTRESPRPAFLRSAATPRGRLPAAERHRARLPNGSPTGSARLPATASSSPDRSARPAPLFAAARTSGRRLAPPPKGVGWRPRARCSTSPTAWRRTPATSRGARCRIVIQLDRALAPDADRRPRLRRGLRAACGRAAGGRIPGGRTPRARSRRRGDLGGRARRARRLTTSARAEVRLPDTAVVVAPVRAVRRLARRARGRRGSPLEQSTP